MNQSQSLEELEELKSKIGEVKVRYLVYKSNLRLSLSQANKNNDALEIKRLSKEIKRVQEIYDNAWKDEELLKGYCSDEKINKLVNKYTELLDEIVSKEDIELNNSIEEDELISKENVQKKPKKKILKNIGPIALAGAMLASGGITMEKYADYEESENDENEEIDFSFIDDILENSKCEPLYDFTDDEQVMRRAEFIYKNYFKETKNDALITDIANTIKVLNGELPMNYSQKSDLDLVDYYSNLYNNLYKISDSFIPSSLFTSENTELSERLKLNDKCFLRLEYYMKNGYITSAESISKIIAHNMWYRFLDDTDTKKELLDYLSFTGPYEQMIFPVIYNSPESINEYVTLECRGAEKNYRAHIAFPIKDIYDGITTGTWSNFIQNKYELFKKEIQEESPNITPALNQISFYDSLKVDLYNKLFVDELLSNGQTAYELGSGEIRK